MKYRVPAPSFTSVCPTVFNRTAAVETLLPSATRTMPVPLKA